MNPEHNKTGKSNWNSQWQRERPSKISTHWIGGSAWIGGNLNSDPLEKQIQRIWGQANSTASNPQQHEEHEDTYHFQEPFSPSSICL